jgi:DNA-binding CsgD family transcriptional regulator
MPSPALDHELVGRESELGVVDGWVARLGRGPTALIVSGEPGIGKTVVWNRAVAAAGDAGGHLLVSRPVEAEIPFGYAGLGDLLLSDGEVVLGLLAPPVARSLSDALLLSDPTDATDPLAVARGTQAALRVLAADRTVIIAIDDVQWLDPSSARSLSFAMRRIDNLPIAVVVSQRDPDVDPLGIRAAFGDRVTELPLGPMSLGAIGRILRQRIDGGMPRREIVRAHELSGGNPFFALELARAGDRGGLPITLRNLVGSRLSGVDALARPAIELAAVLGPSPVSAYTDANALDGAIAAGVLELRDDIVRFAHPLLAAAAYESIGPGRRRQLHLHCASLVSSIESRARHFALATDGSDANVAALLEEAASAAASRGASEAAAELAAHARRLTPRADVDAYARRTMDAVEYALLGGDEDAVSALADEVISTGVRGVVRVRALLRRALVEVDSTKAVSLLESASSEDHEDVGLRARTLAALAWDRGAGPGAVEDAVSAMRMAEGADDATLAYTLACAGWVMALACDPRAVGLLERAVEIRRQTPGSARLAFAILAQQRVWRGQWPEAEALLAEERLHAPEGDEYVQLRLNLVAAENEARRGRWDEAGGLLDTIATEGTGHVRTIALVWRALIGALRGNPAVGADIATIAASAEGRDPVIAAAMSHVSALIERTARDDTTEAGLAGFPSLGERAAEFSGAAWWSIPLAVERLVSGGHPETAAGLTERLKLREAWLDPWASPAVAYCEGLLDLGAGDPSAALCRLDAALQGFEHIGAPWEVGLCQLAKGRALRRIGRRREASFALEAAETIFASLSAGPSALEAADELRRARPRPRHDDALTEAELRVATLVASGRSNKDVAAELFTTVATVEAHLTRVYSKLGIRSRSELAHRAAELIPGGSR